MASWLDARITSGNLKAWSSPDPKVWMADSVLVRDQVYPQNGETVLGYRYVYDNALRMNLQLEKGGVRLAAYLNNVLR